MHIPIDPCLFRKLRIVIRKEMCGDSRGDNGIDEGVYRERGKDLMAVERESAEGEGASERLGGADEQRRGRYWVSHCAMTFDCGQLPCALNQHDGPIE